MLFGCFGDLFVVLIEEGMQSMLIIWGWKNLSNVCKVLWCVEEVGLEYWMVDVGGVFGLVDELVFCVMNLNGWVLVIEDDGFVFWEFNVIVCYLVVCYVLGDFYLQDLVCCVDVDKWMDWIILIFVGLFCDLFWGMLCMLLE